MWASITRPPIMIYVHTTALSFSRLETEVRHLMSIHVEEYFNPDRSLEIFTNKL